MTDLSRSARSRRGGRRPGWILVTALLVLAIAASSALVFTNRVELLKLAVILALWAAVVAAFVSVIYRRQSDMDQAKVRDLKLVYDLQLDREISARREYELSLETQLRRELTSELRAQAADEVAGLRAELAALRANLEILFDADFSHRPAIENDRTTVRAYSDRAPEAGRVTSSRIDTEHRREDAEPRTDESPIIDVPAEPTPPEYEWAASSSSAGAHRRSSESEQGRRRQRTEEQRSWPPPPPTAPPSPSPPSPPPPPASQPERERVEAAAAWAPAEGQWIPPGAQGSTWSAPGRNGASGEYVGRRRAPEPGQSAGPQPPAEPATPPAPQPRRGRHSAPPEAVDPGRPRPDPEPAEAPPPRPAETSTGRRHRSDDDSETGGQSVAELLARLQATPTGGGRRRRRDE